MRGPATRHVAALVLMAASSAGCPACLEPLDLPEGCQPLLAGFDCMLPFPSDAFLVDDGALPSGRRVQLGDAAKLYTVDGRSADVTDWRPMDGFSQLPPIVAVLGVPLSNAGLVGIFDDPAQTLRAGSKSVIIEAASGRFIPHFVDLDPRATQPERQALVLRPLVGLRPEARYVVALQGLERPDGSEAPAPEGFRRLRDGEAGDDPRLLPFRERYEDQVFGVLEEAGLERADLQLAWDFTTGSESDLIADMLRARTLVLEELARHPPTVEWAGMVEGEHPEIWRRITGRIEGPLVMEHAGPGAALARDAGGQVRLNGRVTIPFSAMVPMSVRDQYEPGLLLQYGHGFFFSQDQLETDQLRPGLDRLRAVTFAVDWWGMSTNDVGVVIGALGEQVWETMAFTDRVVQAMANWLSLTTALQGALLELPELRRPTQAGQPGVHPHPDQPGVDNTGQPLYDPSHLCYLGISQGHILGGIYAALNPAIERAVFHVGGAGYSQMMFRSYRFVSFLGVMDLSVPDRLDQQKLVASIARHFDRIDPVSFARFVLRDPLPDDPAPRTQPLQVLMQASVGDAQVPNFTSFIHARLLELPALEVSSAIPYGLETAAAPSSGSAFTLFDLGVDDAFYAEAVPPEEDSPAHEGLRQTEQGLGQMDAFFRQGQVVDSCGGSCVIE